MMMSTSSNVQASLNKSATIAYDPERFMNIFIELQRKMEVMETRVSELEDQISKCTCGQHSTANPTTSRPREHVAAAPPHNPPTPSSVPAGRPATGRSASAKSVGRTPVSVSPADEAPLVPYFPSHTPRDMSPNTNKDRRGGATSPGGVPSTRPMSTRSASAKSLGRTATNEDVVAPTPTPYYPSHTPMRSPRDKSVGAKSADRDNGREGRSDRRSKSRGQQQDDGSYNYYPTHTPRSRPQSPTTTSPVPPTTRPRSMSNRGGPSESSPSRQTTGGGVPSSRPAPVGGASPSRNDSFVSNDPYLSHSRPVRSYNDRQQERLDMSPSNTNRTTAAANNTTARSLNSTAGAGTGAAGAGGADGNAYGTVFSPSSNNARGSPRREKDREAIMFSSPQPQPVQVYQQQNQQHSRGSSPNPKATNSYQNRGVNSNYNNGGGNGNNFARTNTDTSSAASYGSGRQNNNANTNRSLNTSSAADGTYNNTRSSPTRGSATYLEQTQSQQQQRRNTAAATSSGNSGNGGNANTNNNSRYGGANNANNFNSNNNNNNNQRGNAAAYIGDGTGAGRVPGPGTNRPKTDFRDPYQDADEYYGNPTTRRRCQSEPRITAEATHLDEPTVSVGRVRQPNEPSQDGFTGTSASLPAGVQGSFQPRPNADQLPEASRGGDGASSGAYYSSTRNGRSRSQANPNSTVGNTLYR